MSYQSDSEKFTESYDDALNDEYAKEIKKSSEKLNFVEKSLAGKVIIFYVAASKITAIAGWVALVMIWTTPYVNLLDVACIFVISYVLDRSATGWDKAAMDDINAGTQYHVGMILVNNAVMGRDLREIKGILKELRSKPH